MPVPEEQAAPGRDGPAQRPARPRPDPLGRRRAHQGRRDQGRLRPQAARARPSTTSPACAGSSASARRSPCIPLVKKGLPEAKLAFENPSVIGVAAGASIAGNAAAPPRARRQRRVRVLADRAGAGAVRPARRRARRLPRRRAQGDRGLRGRRRGRARRAQGARPLRLAPDGADARRQPGGHADAQAGGGEPNPLAAARSRWRRRRPRSRSSPGPSVTPTRRSRACSSGRGTSCSG